MRSPIFFLFLLFLSPAFGDIGVIDPNLKHSQLNQEVIEAANKTLQIFVFLPDYPQSIILSDFIDPVKRELNKDPRLMLDRMNMGNHLNVKHVLLNDFDKLKVGQNYPINFLLLGTAFFTKDNVLLTAGHTFGHVKRTNGLKNANSLESIRRAYEDFNYRIILMNSEHKIVFDTQNENQSIKEFVFTPHAFEANYLSEEYLDIETSAKNEMLDLAAITLNGFDSRPYQLAIEPNLPKVGENIFTAGYPFASKGRKEANSQGDRIYVSKGQFTNEADSGYSRFLAKLMPKESVRTLYEESLFFTNTDILPGNSGGPILNSKGHVIAMACAVRRDNKVPLTLKNTVKCSYGPKLSLLYPIIKERLGR